jgi:hypothetical protein
MQFFLFGDTSKSSRGDAINLILLQIKPCNHCSLVFCVTIKGSLNISLHFVSSKPKAKISSHFFWPFDTMLFLISNKYISLVLNLNYASIIGRSFTNFVFFMLIVIPRWLPLQDIVFT